jgi:hypothetical protein
MNHRGGDVGYYEAERVDDTTARVRCKPPYLCTYDEALDEGSAELFADGFVRATETSEQCRADGGVCLRGDLVSGRPYAFD